VGLSDTSLTGLSQGTINFDNGSLRSLTINGGSGNNTYTIVNTPSSQIGNVTTLNTGLGTDVVNIQRTSGPLFLNVQGGTGNDVINVAAGAAVSFVPGTQTLAAINGSGSLTVDTGATVTVSGALAAGAIFVSGVLTVNGAVTANDTLAVSSGATITVGGALAAGAITVSGVLTVNGQITGAVATLTVGVGGVLTVNGPVTGTVTTLTVSGSVALNDGSSVTTGQLTLAGGSVTLNGPLVNQGTFTTSGGTVTAGNTFTTQTLTATQGTTTLYGTFTAQTVQVAGGSIAEDMSHQIYTVPGATVVFNDALNATSVTVNSASGLISDYRVTPDNLHAAAGVMQISGTATAQDVNLSGRLAVPGTLTVSGTFTWTRGWIEGAGTTTVAATGTLLLQGASNPADKYLDQSTLNNTGTATWTGTGNLVFTGGATFNNLSGAVFDAQNDASIAAGSGTFVNAGTFRKSGGNGRTTINVAFTNNGTMQVQVGTVALMGSLTNYANNTLTGGTYDLRGTLQVPGADIRTNAATILLDVSGAKLIDGAYLDAWRNLTTITAAGQFTLLTGDSYSPVGDFTNAGVFTLGNGSSLFLNMNLTWSNSGLFQWRDSGRISCNNGAVFNNLAGATFDAQGDGQVTGNSYAFTNAGTLTKSAGVDTTRFQYGTFSNSGAVLVQAGTLSLDEGTSTGSFTVSAGTTLEFVPGYAGAILAAGSVVSGAGQVRFSSSGGATVVNGSFTATGAVTLLATANFNTDTTLSSLTINSGTLGGSGTVTVAGPLTWTEGMMTGTGVTNATGGLTFSGSGTKFLDRTLNNASGAVWTGTGLIELNPGAVFNNLAGATFDDQGDGNVSGNSAIFNNANGSTFTKSGGTGTTRFQGVTFSSSGAVLLQAGTLSLDGGATNSGSLSVAATTTLSISGTFPNFSSQTLTGGTYLISGIFKFTSADIRTNQAAIVLDGSSAQITDLSGTNALANFATNDTAGSFTLQNGRNLSVPSDFRNAGVLSLGNGSTFTVAGNYTQTAGTTLLGGGTLATTGLVDLQGGLLSGAGTINASVRNAAQIDVGGAGRAGLLTINGNFTQTAAGVLNMELGSFDSGSYDRLVIRDTATLDGTLNVALLSDFFARAGDAFAVLTFGARSGSFATTNLPDLGAGFFLDPNLGDTGLTLTTRAR
jgi:hypothetical protein